jgi:hypothetical protein
MSARLNFYMDALLDLAPTGMSKVWGFILRNDFRSHWGKRAASQALKAATCLCVQYLWDSLCTNSPELHTPHRILTLSQNCSLFTKTDIWCTKSTMILSTSLLLVILALCCYDCIIGDNSSPHPCWVSFSWY